MFREDNKKKNIENFNSLLTVLKVRLGQEAHVFNFPAVPVNFTCNGSQALICCGIILIHLYTVSYWFCLV